MRVLEASLLGGVRASSVRWAGKVSELVELPGDDHYLMTFVSRLRMLRAIDAFLAKQLPTSQGKPEAAEPTRIRRRLHAGAPAAWRPTRRLALEARLDRD